MVLVIKKFFNEMQNFTKFKSSVQLDNIRNRYKNEWVLLKVLQTTEKLYVSCLLNFSEITKWFRNQFVLFKFQL